MLRATHHCRHYSWRHDTGPMCAAGVDLSASGACRQCMPSGTGCEKREDYTEAERNAWDRHLEQRTVRMLAAIGALPEEIPLNVSGKLLCPNCGGTLSYLRATGRVFVKCDTPDCCDFSGRFKDA